MLEVKVYSIKEWDLAGRKKQILRKFNKVHVPGTTTLSSQMPTKHCDV